MGQREKVAGPGYCYSPGESMQLRERGNASTGAGVHWVPGERRRMDQGEIA